MHHIHFRKVCEHGYDGGTCGHNVPRITDVRGVDCVETDCPGVTLERHAIRQHKDGGCTCGFPVRGRVHNI